MDDLKARVIQVLDFWAEGKPPDWPDHAKWPEAALNADWLKALYIHTYGDDFRLHGSVPFVVSERTISHGSEEYCRMLRELIAEGTTSTQRR
jgi:hypothetical protein